jgi:prevent-host-death family protein
MNTVNLADAKAHLSELVAQAASGEAVCITRRGKPVARLTGVHTPRRPVALATLQTLTESMLVQAESAGDFVRKMRDGDRY